MSAEAQALLSLARVAYVAYGVIKSREDTLLTAGTGHELISTLPGSSFAVPLVM